MTVSKGPRRIRTEKATGELCARPRREPGPEQICGTPLVRIEILIPGEIAVIICPRCDVIEL